MNTAAMLMTSHIAVQDGCLTIQWQAPIAHVPPPMSKIMFESLAVRVADCFAVRPWMPAVFRLPVATMLMPTVVAGDRSPKFFSSTMVVGMMSYGGGGAQKSEVLELDIFVSYQVSAGSMLM